MPPLADSRLLETLIRARLAIREIGNHDHRPVWSGVVCPSCGVDYRSVTAVDGAPARLATSRIHKASSAESILRHCLRALGFTARYKRDELTGPEHLELLEVIRVYSRQWLRHEAVQFGIHYLGEGSANRALREFGLTSGFGGEEAHGSDVGRTRAIQWEPGPAGYLLEKSKPGFFSNLGRFFRRCKQFVYESIVAGTMALLGPSPLSKRDLDEADKQGQRQAQYFDRFEDEIRQRGAPGPKPEQPIDLTTQVIDIGVPPMSVDQFIARVESYGNAAWQGSQQVNQKVAQGEFKYERRVLGIPKTEHCGDCPPLAALGWQPIGTLPAIGETECNGACLCSFRFLEEVGGQEYFRGKKGPVPAPPIRPKEKAGTQEIPFADVIPPTQIPEKKKYPIAYPPDIPLAEPKEPEKPKKKVPIAYPPNIPLVEPEPIKIVAERPVPKPAFIDIDVMTQEIPPDYIKIESE